MIFPHDIVSICIIKLKYLQQKVTTFFFDKDILHGTEK